MHDYLLAIVLGVVEGVTEFLPVSSTAHLRICQAWLGIDLTDEYWKLFAIVIQLGAILAVVVFFRERIRSLLRSFPAKSEAFRHPLSLTLIAFFVTAVPSFLLAKLIGKNLESLPVIGTSLLVGGIAMAAVDWFCRNPRMDRVEQMTPAHAAWVGLVQILSAVFPGTSRSMSTIAGAQLVGLSRAAALEFSFFLSIPTMIAATGYDFLKTILAQSQGAAAVVLDTHRLGMIATGFVVSFVVAWGVVAWFMGWVKKRGFMPFAAYRIALGTFVLYMALSTPI